MNFYLTNAGLAAFVNPANTGTNAILIDRIGVSSVALPGDPSSHAGLLALPNELKRLSTFAGANVGDNTIHVTIRDESAETYALRTFGLYASTGVLMAYVTSADPISQKTPSSMTLIAADLAFVVAINAQVNFGNTNFLNPPATTVTPGVVELATKEETAEGVDTTRAVTPYGLKWVLDQLLAGYAALVHSHDAAAIVSGVLQVGRIPALGMEKITGLAGALALKLDAANFTWNNLTGKPALVYPDTNAVFLTMQTRMATAANGSIYFGDQVVGPRRLDFNGDLFKFIGAGLQINGHTPWTTQNFNPADKAAAIHSHDWAQVTGKPTNILSQQGVAYDDLDWRTLTVAGVYSVIPQTAWHASNPVAASPYGQLIVTFGGPNTVHQTYRSTAGESWNRQSYNGTWSGWTRSWNSVNFNPADKAAAVHSHDWAQVTGKPVTLVHTDTVQVFTGRKVFKGAGVGTLAAQGWETSAVEVQSTGATDAAVMTFHLPGGVVFKFGLDTDYQWKAVNSAGGVATFWHSANFDPTTKVTNLQASITARGTAGFGTASVFGGDATNSGFVAFNLPDGTRVGYIGAASATGKAVVFAAENGGSYFFGVRPSFNGATPWDSGNFTPSSKANVSHTHTSADITDLLDKFWPAGELRLYAKTSLPGAGVRVLAANGAAVSRTTYARLFTEIGTTYGAGDGATTFNLPDWRAVFFRGLDQGRGLDTGRALGVLQMSQNLQHNHIVNVRTNANTGVGFVEDADGTGEARTVGTTFEGGDEARPINQALLACITY